MVAAENSGRYWRLESFFNEEAVRVITYDAHREALLSLFPGAVTRSRQREIPAIP